MATLIEKLSPLVRQHAPGLIERGLNELSRRFGGGGGAAAAPAAAAPAATAAPAQPARETSSSPSRAASASGDAGDGDRLEATLETLYVVAASDDDFDDAEREKLSEAIESLTGGGMRESVLDAMLEKFESALEEDGLEARLAAIARVLTDKGARRAAFTLAAGVACADEEWSEDEDEALQAAAAAFGIARSQAESIVAEIRAEAGLDDDDDEDEDEDEDED